MAISLDTFDAAPSGFTRIRSVTGQATVNASGGLGNVSGSGASNNQFFRKEFDVGSPDMFAEMDVVNLGTTDDQRHGLLLRATTAGAEDSTTVQNYFQFHVNRPFSNWTMLRWINGTATALTSSQGITWPAMPFKIRIEAEGSQIRAFIAGELVGEWTDTAHASNTYGGIMSFNGVASNTFDNVRFGALADELINTGRMLVGAYGPGGF